MHSEKHFRFENTPVHRHTHIVFSLWSETFFILSHSYIYFLRVTQKYSPHSMRDADILELPSETCENWQNYRAAGLFWHKHIKNFFSFWCFEKGEGEYELESAYSCSEVPISRCALILEHMKLCTHFTDENVFVGPFLLI